MNTTPNIYQPIIIEPAINGFIVRKARQEVGFCNPSTQDMLVFNSLKDMLESLRDFMLVKESQSEQSYSTEKTATIPNLLTK